MQITTKVFGEITIDDEKVINFPSGIIGFPELTDFALIHDTLAAVFAGTSLCHACDGSAYRMPGLQPGSGR